MGAPKLATYEDLLAFTDPEDKRAELIHGVIVERVGPSGEHSRTQALLASWVTRRFSRARSERWPGGWWFATKCDMQYEHHEVFCHDLIGWRRDRMPHAPQGRPQQLRADWACEIISPSTEKRDFTEKMPVLHRAEVPYFWIVRPIEKTLYVYHWTPEGFVVRTTAESGDTVRAAPFDTVELKLAVLFGDEDDED